MSRDILDDSRPIAAADRDSERSAPSAARACATADPSTHEVGARAREHPTDARSGRPIAVRDGRQPMRWRDQTFHLRTSERTLLRTLGTFRTVPVRDLEDRLYGGDARRLLADLRSLGTQDLVLTYGVTLRRGGPPEEIVTLSTRGQQLTAAQLMPPDRPVHAGFDKPRELAHDAALFRMFDAERQRVEAAGGTVRQVALDAELKGQVAAAVNQAVVRGARFEDAQRAVAEAYGLRIVDGSVQIPDLRLEVETAAGDRTRVDLELATAHYKPSQLAAKARAGFTFYAEPGEAGRISAALEDRGLVAEIVSL